MLIKTEAIVLHSLKYGESRLIVDLFTREHGRLSCIVGIPKTGRAKVKKQFFQPLSLIDVECDVRANVRLQKIRDARMLSPYVSLTYEPAKLSISLFLAEFLYHALRGEQQPDPLLFDYMRNSFLWLDTAAADFANFHLAFLMHLSRFLGFYPNTTPLSVPPRGETAAPKASPRGDSEGWGGLKASPRGGLEGVFFDLREGTFCDAPPLHQDFLRPEEAARIHTMMRMDYQNMHLFRMSHLDRNRCLDIILAYYRLHLPSFPELKSLPVLQELYT